ncbi:MAG TPA: creatininase family protein [Clostridia bacterium]|nr:creatininase family protein [Clostridia bacterium]
MEELEIRMLRPHQLKERMAVCPVAYIPLGVLEWHGEHAPFGADTLQAEGIARACAAQGGVVYPPLYYGLMQGRMETIPSLQPGILNYMGWERERFDYTRMMDSPYGERENYVRLLSHILNEAEAFGFKLAVFVCGHYPLIDMARAAVLLHMDARKFAGGKGMLAWAFADFLLVKDRYPKAGDHGANWETSHLMHLHPETVDLSLVKEKPEELIGVMITDRSPAASTAEFGKEIIDYAVEKALAEVNNRLKNPGRYLSHGGALREG